MAGSLINIPWVRFTERFPKLCFTLGGKEKADLDGEPSLLQFH